MPQTDSTLAGITILLTDSAGMITNCISSGVFPTTASKFAVGCQLTDSTTGQSYFNLGTVAVPSWSNESDQLFATVNISSSDILNMKATPIPLLTGVAGKLIIVDSVVCKMVRTATAYTTTGTSVFYEYGTAASAGGAQAATVFAVGHITGSAGTFYVSSIAANLATIQDSAILGLGVSMSKDTAEFASGTGTGTVYLRYRLL